MELKNVAHLSLCHRKEYRIGPAETLVRSECRKGSYRAGYRSADRDRLRLAGQEDPGERPQERSATWRNHARRAATSVLGNETALGRAQKEARLAINRYGPQQARVVPDDSRVTARANRDIELVEASIG